MIVDGDASWFNNPQYRIRTTASCVVNISLTPVNLASDDDMGESSSASLPMVAINVVQFPPGMDQNHPSVGDCLLCNIMASDKNSNVHKMKGQEASIWNLTLEANSTYFVVPNTARKNQRCELTATMHVSCDFIISTINF